MASRMSSITSMDDDAADIVPDVVASPMPSREYEMPCPNPSLSFVSDSSPEDFMSSVSEDEDEDESGVYFIRVSVNRWSDASGWSYATPW